MLRLSKESLKRLYAAVHDAGNLPGVLASEADYYKAIGDTATASRLANILERIAEPMARLNTSTSVVKRPNVTEARKAAASMIAAVKQAEGNLGEIPPETRMRLRASLNVAVPTLGQIASMDFAFNPKRTMVDLSKLVREGPRETYRDKHGRPITLDTRLARNAHVKTNELAMRRVLENLWQDASIHPESEGHLTLHATTALAGAYVRFRVTSVGAKPLTPELMRKIGRESFTTRRPDGTTDIHGVGKVSVNRMVKFYGGSFRACNHRIRGRLHPALEIMLPRL